MIEICIDKLKANIINLFSQTQSCLTVISGSTAQAQSEVIDESEECSRISSAIQHAFNTHSVDRCVLIFHRVMDNESDNIQ